MPKIRVFLTDDHTLFRQGIKTLIAAEPDMEVVGRGCANGTDAVTRATETRPDILLMDIGMTWPQQLEATRQIKQATSSLRPRFCSSIDAPRRRGLLWSWKVACK